MDASFFGGTFGALFGALKAVGIILSIAIWIYVGFAFQTIAKKLKYKKDWLAWVPVARWALIPILAKKHWAWVFMFLVPIANFIFLIIWMWHIYEARKYHGALSLVFIAAFIPFLSMFAMIANLIIIGIVAWRDK